jgi:hypothetical protein
LRTGDCSIGQRLDSKSRMSREVHVRICERLGVRFPRATRRLVCCRSQSEAAATLKVVEKLLARLDLAINPRKTTIQHVEKGFDYLGERLFIKHQGQGSEAVMVRPLKPDPGPLTRLPPRRLPAGRTNQPETEDEDVWEHST